MELTDTLDLRNERTPQILHLPSLPTKVFVYATGAGCATIQGKVTYSTYSTKSDTLLLSISSSVAKEVLPDKSSVEELEGKSPVLKIETCFRWKGPSPSGVLRMEVSLFSGFELVQSSPQLISSPEVMAEMQHGSHANSIWFVFANVSSPCPICVRYNARSSFIISALRPSYARIYPAGREDMAADTFFHTDEGSNLLKGITDDDLITWFGKNSSDERDSSLLDNCFYSTTTKKSPSDTTEIEEKNDATTMQTTSTAENKELMSQLQKLEILSVATYTINVDNETLGDDNDTMSNEEGTNYITSTENIKANMFTSKTTTVDTVSDKDHNDLLIQSNDIPDMSTNKTAELILNNKEKLKHKQHKYINSKKINNVTEKDKTYMTTAIDTTQETTTKSVENSAKKTIVSIVRGFFPKHINTKVQGHPIKYLNLKTTEEPKATFPPEIKNDKYVLLEKEEIWNLLKEIVNDERNLKKTTKLNYNKNPTT
ncbi:hypothetical protein WA026_004139 [Henosepilachna vigintioctopunctata]|uniref:Alpha-macroglobulin receptor-binding domain-containing protein n=1 Tax=Henosepilachna vigintioctopunctata TaxID=420089 RepID=A0AAW1UFD9_9CUCU